MPKQRQNKSKIRWSKLYSFSCVRPGVVEAASIEQLGGPGFSRIVFCNQPYLHQTKPLIYPDNSISTTKYNIISFLPKALFEQFRRVANLYFLLTACLSTTPLAPFTPASIIAPFVFVLGLSLAKEAVEDWQRFRQDLKVNSQVVKYHRGNGVFDTKTWRKLCVGDVVKVEKDEYFPSDLLLLSSSYGDGLSYVETVNLDGETNLKPKRCLEATLPLDQDTEFSHFTASIRCEDPNPNLYSFVGNLDFEGQLYALNAEQVLLRDSKLRNTGYVYGVVIFSGSDTKVVQNSTRSPSKRSHIEKKMDHVIYLLFAILVLISLVSSIGCSLYTKFEMTDWWYLQPDVGDASFDPQKPELTGASQMITSLMLYGYLIPISLYISIEVVRVLQAILINQDMQMYNEETGSAAEARTSNLNEELGQVEMILSDKTGTLTSNQMEFVKCSIAGVSYGCAVSEVDIAASRRFRADMKKFTFDSQGYVCLSQSFDISGFPDSDDKAHNTGQSEEGFKSEEADATVENDSKHVQLRNGYKIKGFNFNDDRLLCGKWINNSCVFDIAMFFRVLALCHTGIPVQDEETGAIKFEAESPEEVAFLIASQEFGFKFCKRTQSVLVLREFIPFSGQETKREYKLLNLLEFSSSRKRMSIIIKDDEGNIFLLCKGADSIIFERLANDGKQYEQATRAHLSDYAEDGLRTLAFAYRRLELAEYDEWNSLFLKAKTTIGPEREHLLESASEMMETKLTLLGAAAVEDKLQKGVPECIDKLAHAGLKIWLLTGDKMETAINVGFACSLLRRDMKQFHLNLKIVDKSEVLEKVLKDDLLLQIEDAYQATSLESGRDTPFALIVEGKALELALQNDVKHQFLRLAVNCASVICCRISPKQKALVARLVKEHTSMITLAIGDGANDVGMIQEADIGVGISGMEGMQVTVSTKMRVPILSKIKFDEDYLKQWCPSRNTPLRHKAVMASDFSLPQFRFLERLLIVHGHWCYKRISKMICYFFYKNITFGLTFFYYEVYTSFSGEILYDDWYMVLFNVILTSLPVISLGVLEQDVSSDVCLQFPALYQQGQRNIYFRWRRILGWILNGAYSSLAIFLLNICIFQLSAFHTEGEVPDLAHLGAIMYTCVIWTVNCQIALLIGHFTWIQHLFIWGSISFWYLLMLIYGTLPPTHSNRGFKILSEALGPAPTYWLATLLVVLVSLLPYFVHIVYQRSFNPMDDHVIQEIKYYKKDVTDRFMWLREQNNAKKKTHVGFSSRVDAKIKYLREQWYRKTMAIYRSMTNSPLS